MNAMVKIERAKTFDPQIADEVLERIALGASLEVACEGLSVSVSSVIRWAREVDTFASGYARAKQLKADFLADQIVPIADDDELKPEDRKVRIDARKWAAAKFNPNAYGDKLDVTSKGEALAAPSHMVDARVQSIVMQAAMRMAGELGDEAQGLLE